VPWFPERTQSASVNRSKRSILPRFGACSLRQAPRGALATQLHFCNQEFPVLAVGFRSMARTRLRRQHRQREIANRACPWAHSLEPMAVAKNNSGALALDDQGTNGERCAPAGVPLACRRSIRLSTRARPVLLLPAPSSPDRHQFPTANACPDQAPHHSLARRARWQMESRLTDAPASVTRDRADSGGISDGRLRRPIPAEMPGHSAHS